jgi:hypothetical protein
MIHCAKVLRLQSTLDFHDTTQADLARHEAEEASQSMLRAELTRQAEHTRHLKAAHARATAKLSTLHERRTAIEVLCEENHALERGAASADELHKTVVHLEAEVEVARAERKAWCVSMATIWASLVMTYSQTQLRLADECRRLKTPVTILQNKCT